MKQNAAIDVDGVLLDCDGAFAIAGSHLLNRPLIKLNNAYDLSKRYAISNDDVMEIFEYMEEHAQGWCGMPALPDAIAAVKQLQATLNIHLVTAIPEKLKNMRLDCLKEHGFVPEDIHCVGHHLASKTNIIRQLDPVMMVDDRLKHLYEASFVKNRAWVDHDDEQDGLEFDGSVYRVKSMQEWVGLWNNNKNNAFKM